MLLQDSPVFDMDYVTESVFEEILASVLEERFPEIESLTEHQRKALLAVINRKDVFANRTWKVNYISVAPWCLQIPVPVRPFIPSSCRNFGCVSSEVSGGLSSSRTSKPWHFISQFEEWRRRWEQFAQRNLFLCIRKSQVLLTEREVEKHAP